MAGNDTHDGSAPERKRRRRRDDGGLVAGTVLILIGSIFLVDQFGWFDFRDLWPVILIGVGLVMIVRYLADARGPQ